MKTTVKLSVIMKSIFVSVCFTFAKAAPHGLFGINVAISAKAYWDGQTKSCLPREKGGCCHIWVDGPVGPGDKFGSLENPGNGSLVYTVSKRKGMLPETNKQYFGSGKFFIDGPITFSPDVLSKLSLKSDFSIPGGAYLCTFNGDEIIIIFKK